MSIVELDLDGLQPGQLGAIFVGGASAVIAYCCDTMHRMWTDLMENPEEVMPWEASLTNLARNYHGSGNITTSLGDMFYMQPGAHGYLARKVEILRGAGGQPSHVTPSAFLQKTGQYQLPEALVSRCCGLVERITAALIPCGQPAPSYRVAVHRLKYHSELTDYQLLAAVTENSLGRWGRAGIRADLHRRTLAGPLNARGLSDALGWMMVTPLLRPLITGLSRKLARYDASGRVRDGTWLVERPHVDSRFFTGLSGDRRNVRTEIFYKDAWHRLPLSRDAIAIFPGTIAQRQWGLQPTRHRVVLERDDPNPQETRTTNSTILFGAV